MEFKSLYYNIHPLFPHIMYAVGILTWFFIMKVLCLRFKKIVKDKITDYHKEELKKVKTDDVHGFMCDLVNEYKFSPLIGLLYLTLMFMTLGSVLAIFDSSKLFLCTSYIILPILEIVIFEMAKSKLKEKLDNDEVIRINEYVKRELSYKLVIS